MEDQYKFCETRTTGKPARHYINGRRVDRHTYNSVWQDCDLAKYRYNTSYTTSKTLSPGIIKRRNIAYFNR